VYIKSREAVGPLGFRPGLAHVLKAQVNPQHLGSENCKSGDTLRSAPLSQIGCFELTPNKVPKTPSPAGFSHTRQEPLFPSPHMHRETQHIYTLINIHIYIYRTIKDSVNKVGNARFINMHI
jgi:hypothetical protein